MGRGALRGIIVAAACAAAILGTASAAAAAPRYASPGGSGSACSQASPCAIQTAVNNAVMGDEVVVAPGNYSPPGMLTLGPTNVNVHGIQGQAIPHIQFTSGSYLRDGNPGDRVSYLALDGTSPAPLQVDSAGAAADQVSAHSISSDACIVFATLTNSVCWTSGATYDALDVNLGASSYNVTLRNVDLEATATGGTGLQLHTAGGTLTTTAVNVIAHGTAHDLDVAATGGSATLNIDHSNYATATGTTINSTNQQMAPPLFVNAAAGDFREAAGSPTIDAGVTDPANGSVDLQGFPRVINGTTDIGAYEFDPFAGVVIATKKAKVKKRKVTVQVGCPAASAPPCAGTLTLTFTQGKKTLIAGSSAFSIQAGTTQALKVKITKKAAKRLAKRGKLATSASATATDAAGASGTTAGKIKLKARTPK
jgi:hypothetical protein